SPENPSWREAFIRLQDKGRIVLSAAIEGRVYARHGTTVETRLTVIDRVPADSPDTFPASPGKAADVASLLGWIESEVPPRQPCALTASAGASMRPVRANGAYRPAAASASPARR